MDQRHAGGQQASAVNLSIGRAQLALPAPPVEQKVEEPAAVQPASRIQAAVKEEGQPKAVDKKDEVQKSEDLEKQLDEAVERDPTIEIVCYACAKFQPTNLLPS